MKALTEHEELMIYRRLLINLHEAHWTGNEERRAKILKKIGNYAFARTNSNGDLQQEEEMRTITLLELDK
jgi:hypothetical protein